MDLIILLIIIGLMGALFLKIIMGILKGGREEYQKQQEEREKERKGYQSRLRHYRYYVHGLDHKNEEGKKTISVILAAARKVNDFYRTIKKADFEEDPYMQVGEFDDVALETDLVPTEYEGEPAVKIYIRDDEEQRHHAGWIPKEHAADVADMINKHRCITWMEIEGGKVKSLTVEDDGKERVEVDEGEEPFPVVKIEYEASE